MNAYQAMGIIVCCSVVIFGVVTVISMQGIHVMAALAGVYFFALWSMVSMQRRARECFENRRRSVGRLLTSRRDTAHVRKIF